MSRPDLARRREELVSRSSAQRAALAVCAQPLVRKALLLDRVVTYVSSHRTASALAVAAVALLVPRRVFGLASRALTIYALFRR